MYFLTLGGASKQICISTVQWKASRWGEGLLWLGWSEEASLKKGHLSRGLNDENKFGGSISFR